MAASTGRSQAKFACLRALCRNFTETLCLAIFFPVALQGICLATYFSFLWWGGTVLRTMMLIYAVWIYFDSAPVRGGWGYWSGISFFHNLFVYKYIASYFPVSIIKTAELSPKHSYLFGCHPHGIL